MHHSRTRLLLVQLALVLAACSSEQTELASPCLPNPCTEGDRTVCTVVDDEPLCSCREGFVDLAGACVQPGPCDGDPCDQPNRGVCVESGSTAICLCDEGYRDNGAGQCVPTGTCTPNPCTQPNRTLCTEVDGTVTCSCIPGTRDDGAGGCVSENPCASEPCTQPNRSICLAQGLTAVCLCDQGYVDDGAGVCVKAATCDPNPCTEQNRSVCSENDGSITCGCDPGYRELNERCVPLNACDPNPCTQANRGQCSDIGGTAVCACDPGFEDRDGACVQSDPCDPNPCTTVGQDICERDGAEYTCLCSPGYRPVGSGCELIPPPTCNNQHETGDTFEPNECPALATPIASASPQSHTLDPAGDLDWVTFTVDGPVVVSLEETGPFATRVSLYDTDGTTPIATNASERLVRKLPAAGTYFAEFRAATPSQTGATTYRFEDLGPDDYGDEVATATPVALGNLTGRFDFPGDWDVLAIPVQAGRIYVFEETTSADVLVFLSTSTNNIVATRDSPESIRFRAATTETLYFGVRLASSSALGTWAVTLADVGADDHADSRDGAATLAPLASPGAALDGRFDFPMDWDCLAVPVTAGRVYRFEEETAFDVYFSILTPTDTLVATRDSPENHLFKASTTETLTVCVRAYSNTATGNWRLRVTDLGLDDHADGRTGATVTPATATPGTLVNGSFEYWLDWDCLEVPVTAGRLYRVAEESGFDVYFSIQTPTDTLVTSRDEPEQHLFKATRTEALTVCIRQYGSTTAGSWALRLTDLGLDDQADGRDGANTMTASAAPGTVLDGNFEVWLDWDCVAVPVTAGRLYRVEEESGFDVFFSILTPTENLVASRDSPELHLFEAPRTETLTVCIRQYGSTTTGAWRLRVTDLGLDDHGDNRDGATSIGAPSPETTLDGSFEIWLDWDCVAVPVTEGRIYNFAETSAFDVYFSIQTPTGDLVGSRDAPESHSFKATRTETLTLCIRQYGSTSIGAWQIRVSDLGLDDHGDARASATSLTVDAAPVAGNIQFQGDNDFFSFAVDGSALAFRLITTGVSMSLQVQNAAGTVVSSSNGPGTHTFSVQSAGTYYVRVVGSSSTTLGAYTIAVEN